MVVSLHVRLDIKAEIVFDIPTRSRDNHWIIALKAGRYTLCENLR
jgi:hypothetical protein